GEPIGPERDLADARARLQPRAEGEGLGPVRDVGARLRAGRAAEIARPAVDARAPTVPVTGEDRAVRRPPVPAERSKPRAMVARRVSRGIGGVCRGDFGG